ncbi:hypothetical protein AC578_9948 [Pseudocercospora eumusae]|uniref:Uncharacterized protein n=1 Tax=Pseudocercospora eumusae TaxID=321146 RepID=A0A139H0G0_9PEZI|nr:hypothetical protein AC578_9948 [Pseudocercospora eumusae]
MVHATHNTNSAAARAATFEQAENLYAPNGSMGEVVDIIGKSDTAYGDLNETAPWCILVAFDHYDWRLASESITITSSNQAHDSWSFNRIHYQDHSSDLLHQETTKLSRGPLFRFSVFVFPLTIAYAVTIHKAQGITTEKAVLSFAKKDFVSGQSSVASSRVKTLNGISCLISHLTWDHFTQTSSHIPTVRQADIKRRLPKHLSTVPDYDLPDYDELRRMDEWENEEEDLYKMSGALPTPRQDDDGNGDPDDGDEDDRDQQAQGDQEMDDAAYAAQLQQQFYNMPPVRQAAAALPQQAPSAPTTQAPRAPIGEGSAELQRRMNELAEQLRHQAEHNGMGQEVDD